MTQELGLCQKFGLRVQLSRELGRATIRDKIIHGELEAAHALAAMPPPPRKFKRAGLH